MALIIFEQRSLCSPFPLLEGGVTREVMVLGEGGQMRVRMVMKQQTRLREIAERH